MPRIVTPLTGFTKPYSAKFPKEFSGERKDSKPDVIPGKTRESVKRDGDERPLY